MAADTYYLPCECGHRSVVDPSQSGRTIACTCGRTLEVPPLRGLRALERVPPSTQATPRSPAWNPARGLAVVALLPLIGALAFGAYAYWTPPPPPPSYPSPEGGSPRVLLYQVWFRLVDEGIDDSSLPPVQAYIEAVDRRRGWMVASGVVAGISALGVAAGMLWPQRRTRPASGAL